MNKCEDLPSDICKDTHSLVDTKKVVLASVDLNFCRGLPRGLGSAGKAVRRGHAGVMGEGFVLQGQRRKTEFCVVGSWEEDDTNKNLTSPGA